MYIKKPLKHKSDDHRLFQLIAFSPGQEYKIHIES